MDYVEAAKEYNVLSITSFIPKLQNNAPRSPSCDYTQSKWDPAEIGLAKEGSKTITYLNTTSKPLSVVEEAAGKDCFKIFYDSAEK
jgi:hypothetical protein